MIVSGCRFGVAMRGGRPKQCTKTVVATITIRDAKGRHGLDVCQEHYQHFVDTRQGTEYTEDNQGTSAPQRVHLVSLSAPV